MISRTPRLPTTSLPKSALSRATHPNVGPAKTGPKPAGKTPGRRSSVPINKKRGIAIAATFIVMLAGFAWYMNWIGPDRRLSAIRHLQAKLGDESLSAEERKAAGEELGKRMQELPDDLRFKAMQPPGGRGGFGPGGGSQRMLKLLAMSEKDRTAELDKQLDQMVEGMKRFQQAQDAVKNAAQQPGSGQQQGQAAKPNGQGGSGGPPGGFQRPTDAQMSQFRNRMLSSVPADARAAFGTFHQLLQARAEQRGIPLPQWGPR